MFCISQQISPEETCMRLILITYQNDYMQHVFKVEIVLFREMLHKIMCKNIKYFILLTFLVLIVSLYL